MSDKASKSPTSLGDATIENAIAKEDMEVGFQDKSNLLCKVVVAALVNGDKSRLSMTKDGSLYSPAYAEDIDATPAMLDSESLELSGTAGEEAGQVLGPGKRKCQQNTRYWDFWRHCNEDTSDIE